MSTQKKEFDCIQVKRDAQTKIYQAIRQVTPEEEIAYFQQSVDQNDLSEWWKSVPSLVELPETH